MEKAELKNKTVYQHRNPDTGEIFYIGMGNSRRPYQFLNRSERYEQYVKVFKNPIVEILKENISKEEAFHIEERLIRKYGRIVDGSGTLLNIEFGKSISKEGKAKMSKARLGKPMSKETKEKLSKSTKGKKKSKAHSDSLKRRWERWRIENGK